jgi:glycosyltransferase involved in cell wall biosynthesis
MAGDGPERPRLEALASKWGLPAVHFTGHLEKRDLDGVVRRAEAVVLPAVWPENAPFTVLEAAAQGVPVIVSDMGGLPEMARVVGGTVFPGGDEAALARAVAAVWDDPGPARERAREGRTALRERYDRERHMGALESIYRDALERAS